MGSRLVAETAWERYGGDESADGTVTILPRRICGRCCFHAICSCWGADGGERDYRDESADAAVGVEVLGSEREETNLRTVLLPCYLQLLGWRCWGARLPRRICGRCCWGGGAGERDCGDESADGAVTMLFAAVGVEVLGSETTETDLRTLLLPCYLQLTERTNLRTLLLPCYLQLLVQVLGSETEETNLRTLLLPCYLQRRVGAAGKRYGGDESVDGAVTMLFGAVGAGLLGSDTEETTLRTVLLPCFLLLLGWRCWGARLRRRICGRCCCHAICSCWGGGAGGRYGGDESADGAVAMLFAAVGVQLLGSEMEETNLRVAMLFAAVGVEVLGSDTKDTNLRTVLLPCYLGAGAGERYGGDESADAAVMVVEEVAV